MATLSKNGHPDVLLLNTDLHRVLPSYCSPEMRRQADGKNCVRSYRLGPEQPIFLPAVNAWLPQGTQ